MNVARLAALLVILGAGTAQALPAGERGVLDIDGGLSSLTGIAVSADGTQVYAADGRGL